MSAKPIESWLVTRYRNVTHLLSNWTEKATTVAWVVGAGTILVAYPLAISILDDRFLAKKGIKE